jgi:hypothetical protein
MTTPGFDKEAKDRVTASIEVRLEGLPCSDFTDIADGLRRIASSLDKASVQGSGHSRLAAIGKTGALLQETMTKYMKLIGAEVACTKPAVKDDGSVGSTAVIDMHFPLTRKSNMS